MLTHILNGVGTIEAEVTVARFAEDRFYMMFAAFSEQKISDWLVQHRLSVEQVDINIFSEERGCLVLSGPRSRDVLSGITDAALDNAHWPWLRARTISAAGVDDVRALRMSYQGELGWELHTPMSGMGRIYDALWHAGEPHGMGFQTPDRSPGLVFSRT